MFPLFRAKARLRDGVCQQMTVFLPQSSRCFRLREDQYAHCTERNRIAPLPTALAPTATAAYAESIFTFGSTAVPERSQRRIYNRADFVGNTV